MKSKRLPTKMVKAYQLLDQTDQLIKEVRRDLLKLREDTRFGTMPSDELRDRIKKIERRLDLWDGIE